MVGVVEGDVKSMADPLDDLHAPLTPILRHILARLTLPRSGVALDVACGPGRKTPLLAAALRPGVRLVGLDRDRHALQRATIDHRASWLAGDAHALPLRD